MSDIVFILLSSTVVLTQNFLVVPLLHLVSNMSVMRPCSAADRQIVPDLGWKSSKNHGSIMKKVVFRAN
jgi:hypothetical protein